MLFNYKIPAKPISYMCKAGTQEAVERDYKSIKYIVIHYTGNTNDTAKNNLDYFHNGNTRSAGAHYFVDQKGKAGKSINLKKHRISLRGRYSNPRQRKCYLLR